MPQQIQVATRHLSSTSEEARAVKLRELVKRYVPDQGVRHPGPVMALSDTSKTAFWGLGAPEQVAALKML